MLREYGTLSRLEVNAVGASSPRTKDRKPRGLMKRILLLLLTLTAAFVSVSHGTAHTKAATAEEETPVEMRKGRTVMYIMDAADLMLRDEDAHKLDQLNYSFALIRNGKADGSHWLGLKKVQSFLKKHPHVDGVLSVGGWGADGFSDACLTEESRKILADSLLTLMDDCGFVGIDVDWEYPGVPGTGIVSRPEVDVENWFALLELLRAGLDEREARYGRAYHLSAALGAGDQQLEVLAPARLAELLDQCVLMTYDLAGFDRITGHHSGLYPDEDRPSSGARAVRKMISGGFPAEKLLLGMPAYGKVWRQVSGGGDGLDQRAATSGNKTVSFDELLRLEDQGYTRYFDDKAKVPWWFNGTNFVSGDDGESIACKGEWVVDNGLMGMAVWQYTQDQSGAMLGMLDASMR